MELKEYLNETMVVVLYKDGQFFTSNERGIKPLLSFVTSGQNYSGAQAADKIVGKAAALLFVLLGVESVYGAVMSRAAVAVLQKYNIAFSYGLLTDYIINRRGDGPCPMEETVAAIDEPQVAYLALLECTRKLQGEIK